MSFNKNAFWIIQGEMIFNKYFPHETAENTEDITQKNIFCKRKAL